MGRSGCGPCCGGEPTLKTPCYDNSSKTYYKVGGGGWKTASEFTQHVTSQGNTGYHGLTAIKHVQKRSSYGEYSALITPYILPKSGDILGPGDDSYYTGNPDVGRIIPSLWTVTIGSGNEAITIIRKVRAGSVYITSEGSQSGSNPQIDYHYTISEYLVQYRGKTIYESQQRIPYKKVLRFDVFNCTPRDGPGYFPCDDPFIRILDHNFFTGGHAGPYLDKWGNWVGGIQYCLTYPFC